MRREAIFVLILVALLALILLRFEASGGYQVYVPTGYIQEVERMAESGSLVYDCASDRIETRNLSEGEGFFFRNSYLRRDLAAWNNDGDRRPFLVEREEKTGGGCEGRLMGPNPSHHKQRLPSYEASQWRGSLYLRPGRTATVLTSSARSLEVVGAPRDLLPLPARAFEDVGFRPGSPGIRSQKLALKLNPWDPTFAELKNIGQSCALEVKQSEPRIWLNGCELPLGWRARLDAADRLRFYREGSVDEHYLVETGPRAGLVSFVSSVNGELRRRTFSDRLVMAQEIAYAVDAVVRAAQGEEERRQQEDPESEPVKVRDDFDVHLTLDPFLDQRLQAALGEMARERYGKRPVRASMAVLAADSGRVLALPSYPTPSQMDELRLKSDGHRALLTQNHNFMTHPVGSAAKPFLAAAALSLRPELADLRVPCFPVGGELPDHILGYSMPAYNLPPDCQGGDSQGRVGLSRFLEVSSNRYMLYMGILALAEWQNGRPLADPSAPDLEPDEGFYLAGRRYTVRPQLSIFRDIQGQDSRLSEVAEQDFMLTYRDLFGQNTHFRRGSMIDALDLEPWRPVLDAAGISERNRAVAAFSPVSAERVNLGANLVQSLRRDLYTLLLGNGNNRWSNVQLAEAMARLVHGKRLEAHLLEKIEVLPRDLDSEGAEPEPLWQLQDAGDAGRSQIQAGDLEWRRLDRSPILEGMRLVVEGPMGTAQEVKRVLRQLNRRAPKGVQYKALGKTGTPTLSPAVVKRSPTRMGPEALQQYAGSKQVQSGVLVMALERHEEGAATQTLTLAAHVDSQGGSTEAVNLVAELIPPMVEAYWPEDWLRGKPN